MMRHEALFLAASIAMLDGSGTVSQRWRTEPASNHEALSGHALRHELLNAHRSQLGSAAAGAA